MTSESLAPTLRFDAPLLVGFGITGRAMARALVDRGNTPLVVDDRPNDDQREEAIDLGISLIESPSIDELHDIVASASVLLPSPGVPDDHPVFAAARSVGVAVASEFDLARAWDDRPVVAITGTNGKTTVTTMVTDALRRSGLTAEAVGNTDLPFVQAIDNPDTRVFVVEASSFRLAHSARFQPDVAAWLNFAPDHLDAHATLDGYEKAKASIWAYLEEDAVVVGNLDDAVVASHLPTHGADGPTVVTFTTNPDGESHDEAGDRRASWRVASGPKAAAAGAPNDVEDNRWLVGPDGPLVAVSELARRQPHDLSNALAVAAIALAAGASVDGVVEALRAFEGLAHRLELIASSNGVEWYNDSKATVPHATVAAVGGFRSVVLIAGGRNKGLSLDPLRQTVPPVRTVVAIGDAASEVQEVFGGRVPVSVAVSMADAIHEAKRVSAEGDAVLLSPGCTSFDWYPNYVERGLAFSRLVREELGTS